MKIELSIKLLSDLENLISDIETNIADNYTAILETNVTENIISIVVYYDSIMYPHVELSQSKANIGKHIGKNISQVIQISEIKKKDVEHIDLSESKFVNLAFNNNYFDDNFQKRYFILNIDNVKIAKSKKPHFNKSTNLDSSNFFLEQHAIPLIEKTIPYYSSFRNNFYNVDKPELLLKLIARKEFIELDDIKIHLGYSFDKSEKQDSILITKSPRLLFIYKNKDTSLIEQYAKLICSLISLYQCEHITYNFAQININSQPVLISQVLNNYGKNQYKLSSFGFIGDIYELLTSVNTTQILKTTTINSYSKFVDRFIWALTLEGEAKFMLLYNVLEQIRNTLINPSENNDEFDFTLGKKKASKYIRDVLRSISEIVVEHQIDEFAKQVITHAPRIKYKPMTNQFDDLFIKLNLNLSDFDISFKELKEVRDDIFHGHSIALDDMRLIKANDKLPIILGRILLQMVGIELEKPIMNQDEEE